MRSRDLAPALALALASSLTPSPALHAAAAAPPFEALSGAGREWRSSDAAWRPDGAWLTYVWKENDARELRALEAATGEEIWKLPFAGLRPEGEPEGAAPIEPARYLWSPKSDAILFEAGGDLFLYRLAAAKLRRLTRTEAAEESPAFAPDGARIAFVRAADLWVLELESGQELRLTEDGAENEILNGTTDWVYWEEIWNRHATGFWWSPDSRTLAFYRFDLRGVGRQPLVDDREVVPTVRWQRYPKAGSANPEVRVGVVDLATRTVRWMATDGAEESYLARVHWRPDGAKVAVERLNREQTRLDLLLCDPDRGDCAVWASQTAATWVNLGDEFRFLRGGGFLWGAEDEGWCRIYLHDELGRRRRPLTPEGWAVEELEGVYGGESEVVVVTAYRTEGLGAAHRQVVALDRRSGVTKVIGAGDGWHQALVAPDGRHWLHEWSDLRTPERKTLEAIEGREIRALPGAPVWPQELLDLPAGELLQIPGPNGSRLPARLIRPAGFDPKRRYPILMYHYGGPGSQVVAHAFDARHWLWARWMAARGYAVLAVDNEASRFFGKRGEERVHRAFGPLELAAQLAAVDFLRTQAWADTSRIGLWGWSGGGTQTLYALLHAPGTWRAAVAGAPVTDWRLYDTVWTERYMDSPAANPEGYAAASPLTAATRLHDALLLVHGTADDNVHLQNSIVFAEKPAAAGIPFDPALYPGEKHILEPAARRHYQARMTEFFDRQLQPRPR